MHPRAFLPAVIALLACSALFAADPPRGHKCVPATERAAGLLVEPEAVVGLELLESAKPQPPPECKAAGSPKATYEYEVIIDEKGEIECAFLLNLKEVLEAKGVPPCVVKATTQAVALYRFTPPRDKSGRAVACFYVIRFTS